MRKFSVNYIGASGAPIEVPVMGWRVVADPDWLQILGASDVTVFAAPTKRVLYVHTLDDDDDE